MIWGLLGGKFDDLIQGMSDLAHVSHLGSERLEIPRVVVKSRKGEDMTD